MPLFKETVQFAKPLKSIRVVPPGPPPEPSVPENVVKQREAAARQQGVQEAQQQMNQQILEQRKEVEQLQQQVLGTLEKRHQAIINEINHRLPALVITLVRRILPGIESTPESVQTTIEEALGELSNPDKDLTVHLSEGDYALLGSYQENFASNYPGISFEKDTSLTTGDVVLRSRFGTVDARVETKLKKIEDSFKSDS